MRLSFCQKENEMKRGMFRFVLAAMVLVLASVACNFSASTANIRDAYMARDDAGADRTTVFAQEDVFYCIVEVANAPEDTTVKVIWYAVNVENTEPNTLIDQYELTTTDATLPFNLVNNQGLWPRGTYKAEIYLNGTLDRTLDFEVQ
jgi:hypothetical protein